MAKFKNASVFIDDNGVRKIKYDIVNKKGEVVAEDVERPYFDKNYDVDEKSLDILTKAAKQDEIDRVNAKNDELDDDMELNDENELDDDEMDNVKDVNHSWFKKAGKYIVLAAAGLGIGLAIHNGFNPKTTAPVETTATTEASTDSELENAKDQVEGSVEVISYDEAIKDMSDIGDAWEKLGYKDVSQRSLNSLYFATNYDMFEASTVKEMTDNNVVSDDPMTIIADSLEPLSVCQDQGGKAETGQNKEVIDMSMFCKRAEDKKLISYGYNSLLKMRHAETDEEAQAEFESYYHYLNNEETTEFPFLYNDADKGANYLLNQAYGGIFCIAGGEHGVSQSQLDYLEKHTGMNDFSSVIKEMEGCSAFQNNDEAEATITDDEKKASLNNKVDAAIESGEDITVNPSDVYVPSKSK